MAATVRVLAFGTADGSLWGVAVDPGEAGSLPALVVGAGEAGAGIGDGLTFSDAAVRGDGVALELAAQPPVAGDAPEVTGRAAAGHELVHVRGSLTVGGGRRDVDCPGVLVRAGGDGDGGGGPDGGGAGHGGLRVVAGWFGHADAFALLAARGRPDAPPDADRVAATLFESTGWIAVSDPRLSTTYDGNGLPTRASLELWVGEGEEEFPRRAAAEASGPPGAVATRPGAAPVGGVSLQALPLRCHSRGEEGAGVYVLVSSTAAAL